MNRLWILVADSSRAKIFEADLSLNDIREIQDLVHEESRMAPREITTDGPGSNAASGAGSHHHFEQRTSVREQQAVSFAREIEAVLDDGRNRKEFAKLAVIAPPDFLGHLRGGMNEQVKKLVACEVTKNMVEKPIADIRKLLPKTFYSRIS